MQRRAELKVLNGDHTGQVFSLEEGRTVLGRQVGDVVLHDKEVSSIHAIISFENGAWRVMDLGSTNGVYVNGKLTPEAVLGAGAEIRIGQTHMQFMDLAGEESGELRTDVVPHADTTNPIRSPRRMSRSVMVGAPLDLGFGKGRFAAPSDADTEEIPLNGLAPLQENGARAAVLSIVLEVVEGVDRGLVYRFDSQAILLGRLNTDLVVRDSDVSRRHAIIEVMGDQVILRDLNSTNGTWLNNQRVMSARLQPGDRIRLGRCLLAFGLQGKGSPTY